MKYYGKIGFVTTEEAEPGKWVERIVERSYYGDVLQNIRRWDTGISINDNVKIQNRISIVADPFAHNHIGDIRYIEFVGCKWKAASFDIQYPRIIITTGEVYNEQTEN